MRSFARIVGWIVLFIIALFIGIYCLALIAMCIPIFLFLFPKFLIEERYKNQMVLDTALRLKNNNKKKISRFFLACVTFPCIAWIEWHWVPYVYSILPFTF